jgi:hypothetical protein
MSRGIAVDRIWLWLTAGRFCSRILIAPPIVLTTVVAAST